MKAPAFQFYAGDFLVGVMGMSDEEVGIYIRMLAVQWERGSLPKKPLEIKKLIGAKHKPTAAVLSKFDLGIDGFLRNSRLEIERKKQESYRTSRAENAKKRWSPQSKKDACASCMHEPCICIHDALQSSSSSSTSVVLKNPPGTREAPKSAKEVEDYASHFAVTSATPERPDQGFCAWWFDEQEKCGWCDPKTHLVWHDWRAAFRAAWRGSVHNRQERESRGKPPAGNAALHTEKSKYGF